MGQHITGGDTSVISNMVRSDFQVIGRDEEEYVLMFAQDLDVGFITGRYVINQTFVLEIEPMAVPGGTGGIIKNGLMRDLDAEDITQDLSSFSGWHCERNIEGQNQTEDILTVMNSCQLDRRLIW